MLSANLVNNGADTGKTDIIILAAGLGTRFISGNKLLYNYNGKPIVRYTLDAALKCKTVDNVFLVFSNAEVAALCGNIPKVNLIYNEHPEYGQSMSIRLGTAVSNACHYLYLLADMPFINEETIDSIVREGEYGKIIQPYYNDKPGNPCLFSSSFREELLSLQSNENARLIIKRHPDCVKRIYFNTASVIRDIDYIDDIDYIEDIV